MRKRSKQELTLAKRLSPSADTEITGILLKNDIDASGFSQGYTTIEARFVVKRGDQIRYDQVKAVRQGFPSSFAAAVAVPRAAQEYLIVVQKLLAAVYANKAFDEALRP